LASSLIVNGDEPSALLFTRTKASPESVFCSRAKDPYDIVTHVVLDLAQLIERPEIVLPRLVLREGRKHETHDDEAWEALLRSTNNCAQLHT